MDNLKDKINEALTKAKNNKLKSQKTDNISDYERKLNEEYTLNKWIENVLSKIDKLSISTHPGKFVHPSSKNVPVISIKPTDKIDKEGYLNSFNNIELDCFGDAKYMDVSTFLRSKIENMSLLEHLKLRDNISSEFYSLFNEKAAEIEERFDNFFSNQNLTVEADPLIKQVFFPVADNEYHVLAPLVCPSCIAKISNNIDLNNEFIKNNNLIQLKKENKKSDSGFWEMLDLTVLSYGGVNYQNISIINKEIRGKTYLFSSLPPIFEKRKYKIPRYDFFKESLFPYYFKSDFIQFHYLCSSWKSNYEIKNEIVEQVLKIIEKIGLNVFFVREEIKNLVYEYDFSNLNNSHRIMLLGQDERYDNYDWLEIITNEAAKWFYDAYSSCVKNSFKLSDAEFNSIKKIIFSLKEIFIQ